MMTCLGIYVSTFCFCQKYISCVRTYNMYIYISLLFCAVHVALLHVFVLYLNIAFVVSLLVSENGDGTAFLGDSFLQISWHMVHHSPFGFYIRPPNNLCYVEYITDVVKHPIFPAIYYNGGMHKYNIVSLLGHSRESTTMLLLMITMIRRIILLRR